MRSKTYKYKSYETKPTG